MKYSDLFKIYQETRKVGLCSCSKPFKSDIARDILMLKSNDSSYLRFVSGLQSPENDEFYSKNLHQKDGYCQFFRLNGIALSLIELIVWDYEPRFIADEEVKPSFYAEAFQPVIGIPKQDLGSIWARVNTFPPDYEGRVNSILNVLVDATTADCLLLLNEFFNYLGIPMLDSLRNHLRF